MSSFPALNCDMTGRILLISRDLYHLEDLKFEFLRLRYHVDICNSLDEALVCSEYHSYDALLLDANIADDRFIENLLEIQPMTKIYSIVGEHFFESITECIECGMNNVISQKLGPQKIAEKVCNSLVRPEKDFESVHLLDYPSIIGRSLQHIRVLEKINQIKDVDASVLITGESGTGKELIAHALHETSNNRSKGRFEAVNCGAIPENLLESELFGHKRGAFTDAKTDKKGLFELCSNGTLLLDEIGEMPLELQVKILRALQEKEIRPVGSNQSVKINTRIIAATNRNLIEEIEKGKFRLDLYYRLSVLKIHIPPLRQRKEDIPILVNHFLKLFTSKHGKDIKPLDLSQQARIEAYPWMGNVRELQNAMERAVIFAKNGELELDHLFQDDARLFVSDSTEGQNQYFDMPVEFTEAKSDFEARYLKNLLSRTAGNVSKAARLAKKSRVEIYRFLTRNNIEPSEFRH